MKASSAVNYLYVHTDDGGVEALLFAVKRLTTAVCVTLSCHKMRRKFLHDGNSLIKVCTCLYCTSIMQNRNTPHVLIRFVFTSIMTLAGLR